ncbi:MAG: S8 family serine peptidase [Hyphomicrobiaceae bacterium]
MAKPPRRVRRQAPRPTRTPPPRRTVAVLPDRRPDEIVVLLDQTQAGNVEFAIAQQYRLVRLQGENNEVLQARVQRYRIPDRRTPADVIAAMQGDPRVSLVQPNYLYRLQSGKKRKRPADKKRSMSAMQYAPASMHLDAAHKLATGQQAVVAVIDSGIDPDHPELADALAGAFNAVGDRKPKPDAHGTAIAGIIGARAKLLGVAPSVQLLAARAFFRERGGPPLTTTFVLLRAVDWSFRNKARVFNLSFTGPEDSAVRKILKTVHNRGAILVAAAGNAGPKAPAAYPAAYPEVLAITALDKTNKLYKKANRGGYVAAAAPGVDVLVPIPRGGYDVKSGTSFAAAHISGLIALMLERNPALTTEQIRTHITSAAHDLGPKGHDNQFGAGRADALAAVQAVIKNAGKAPLTAQGRPPVSQASDRK